MANGGPAFEDARFLYDRAQKHIAEFNSARQTPPPWAHRITHDPSDGNYVYTLHLDRSVLRALKPIVADAANNLVHALDQVLAACAKDHGSDRHRHRHYPMASDDDLFERRLGSVSSYVSNDQLSAFRSVREKHRPWLPHLDLVKELSNAAKHWELTPTSSTAHGVGFADQTQRRFVDIPAGHFIDRDAFEFWRSTDRPEPVGFETLVGFQFDGLGADVTADPGTVFSLASRHVLDVIEAAEARKGLAV